MCSVLLLRVIGCDAHVAKRLIFNTPFSLLSVRACLTLACFTCTYDRLVQEADCEGHQSRVIIVTPEDLCSLIKGQGENKQWLHSWGSGGRVEGPPLVSPLIKKCAFPITYLCIAHKEVCFPTNSRPFSPSPSVNTGLSDGQRQKCEELRATADNGRLGKCAFSLLWVVNQHDVFWGEKRIFIWWRAELLIVENLKL